MNTRSTSDELVSSFLNPERIVRNRQRNLLLDFEEVNKADNRQGPPPVGLISPPIPQNHGPPPVAMDFGLRHHMIQQVQNSCQFYELQGDDANRHIDKFLEVTQHMKQNGVSDDTLRLTLFPYSLTHHATAWFDLVFKKVNKERFKIRVSLEFRVF
ncbi:hypothetical protein Tco_0289951 [Tanacetum coccineum]